jgi:hypothetical protein
LWRKNRAIRSAVTACYKEPYAEKQDTPKEVLHMMFHTISSFFRYSGTVVLRRARYTIRRGEILDF